MTVALNGTSTQASPSNLPFLLTSHVNSTNLGQKIEMYDFVANAWVALDSRPATQSDSSVTAVVTSPARFVQSGTLAMKARLTWIPTGITSAFPWSVSIDQAVWNVSP